MGNFKTAAIRSLQKYSRILSWLTILLTFLFIIKGMVHWGMHVTHDGEIHIIRSMHFFAELQNGQFPVRVAPDLAFRHSYPIFSFFYPLPYYLASIPRLFNFSAVDSWKLMEVTVSFLSIAAFYAWLRCHFKKEAATVGTILYTLLPFRLVTLYVTGQVGATFSLLWAPLIALSLYHTLVHNKHWSKVLLALSLAGLITSHLLSLIIFALPLTVYCCALLFKRPSRLNVRNLLFWSLLGIGLSAFYSLPFMLEKTWIKLGHEILVNHRAHWPTLRQIIYSPWGYGHSNEGPHDGMTFQIGIALLAGSGIATILIALQKKISLAFLMLFTFTILVFLLLPYSAPVWEIIKPLQYIQFPWRLLAATGFVGCWLVAWSINQLTGTKMILYACLILLLAFYNSRNYTAPWPLDWRQDNDYRNDEKAFFGPTDISWELMPVQAKDAPVAYSDSVLNASEEGVLLVSDSSLDGTKSRRKIEVVATESSELDLNIWNYPFWEVTVNKQPVSASSGENGRMLVPISEGRSIIEVSLHRTLAQKIGDVFSLSSTLIILIATTLSKRR